MQDATFCMSIPWEPHHGGDLAAEALYRRCSNISGPPFHRHIVMNGGIVKMASAYAPELVNTVLRALRQQMLDDG